MRCKSCNEELNSKESVRKDQNGEFLDLCGLCNAPSRAHWLEATREDTATMEVPVEPIVEDTRTLRQVFEDMSIKTGLKSSWYSEGVGLMSIQDRGVYLYFKAYNAFKDALNNGLKPVVAFERATKTDKVEKW